MIDVRNANPLRHICNYVYIGVSAVQEMARKSEVEMIVSSLREKFVVSAGENLDAMDQLIAGIGTHDGAIINHAHEIKKLTHALKGTAGSFGFMSITRIAEAFDEYIDGSEHTGMLAATSARNYSTAMRTIIENAEEPDMTELEDIISHLAAASLPES